MSYLVFMFSYHQMSLTLEEKQRLAKEQEQAAKLRKQQPLAPESVKPAANNNSQVQTTCTTAHKQLCHADGPDKVLEV